MRVMNQEWLSYVILVQDFSWGCQQVSAGAASSEGLIEAGEDLSFKALKVEI